MVTPDIFEGRRLIRRLKRTGFPMTGAFWQVAEEEPPERWRLNIASARVLESGPRSSYSEVLEALERSKARLDYTSIKLMSPDEHLVVLLLGMARTGALREGVLHNQAYVGPFLVPYLYLYDLTDQLSLDTNFLIDRWQGRAHKEATEELIRLAKSKQADLEITRRIRDNIPTDPLGNKLNELSELRAVFRFGVSTIGGPDFIGSDHSTALDAFYSEARTLAARRITEQQQAQPPDERDWDHLVAHETLSRDYFLTWDYGLLCLKPELEERFDLAVLKPEEYLASRKQLAVP
jgi:hypothetical protein